MGLTTDPNDPDLGHGVDEEESPQNQKYLVKEDSGEFVRPVRTSYVHNVCGGLTTMVMQIAETYARDPKFYGATYCVHCRKHLPVGEFVWAGTNEVVGS